MTFMAILSTAYDLNPVPTDTIGLHIPSKLIQARGSPSRARMITATVDRGPLTPGSSHTEVTPQLITKEFMRTPHRNLRPHRLFRRRQGFGL